MGQKPKRRGISLGTISMLLLTGIVVAGCMWLFPKLMGQVDFQFDASQLAVAIDESYTALSSDFSSAFQPFSNGKSPTNSPATFSTPEPLHSQATETPVPSKKVSFTMLAAGTIHINSAIQKAMTDDSGYHFSWLFEPLQKVINADLSIFTLKNLCMPNEKLSDTNVPTDLLSALRSIGFNALCLGHHDVLNGGIDGLIATKNAAQNAGLTPYGAYVDQQERNAMTLFNANGISVGLLSYQNEISSTGKKKTTKEEQTYTTLAPTLPTISADIQSIRAAGAQVVVVSLCWGKSGADSPTQIQRDLAQSIANAGADILLGTHSGIGAVQTIEILSATRSDGSTSQTLCAYSLGNLLTYNRDKRSGLASLLLHAKVIYDLTAGTVSFDQLAYTPTYAWRGKEENVTRYRVLASDASPPSYVQKDQQNIMSRCLKIITDTLQNSPVSKQLLHE